MNGYLIEVDKMDDAIWANRQEIDEKYAIPTAFKVYKEELLAYWNK